MCGAAHHPTQRRPQKRGRAVARHYRSRSRNGAVPTKAPVTSRSTHRHLTTVWNALVCGAWILRSHCCRWRVHHRVQSRSGFGLGCGPQIGPRTQLGREWLPTSPASGTTVQGKHNETSSDPGELRRSTAVGYSGLTWVLDNDVWYMALRERPCPASTAVCRPKRAPRGARRRHEA